MKEEYKELMLIGDVHCKVKRYQKIVDNHDGDSIQVGDFGFKKEHEWHLANIDSEKHKINFGNHEDTNFLNKSHSLGDFSFISKRGLMTVRGAFSIDKIKRTEGRDWFDNEEMNYGQMQKAVDVFIKHKPKIMVTHDCPKEIRKQLFGIQQKSITSNGLQAMLNIHAPDLWVFGHFHRSTNEVINGTRFICLAELETMIIH